MSKSNSTEKSNKSNAKRSSLKIIISFQLGNMMWFMVNQVFRMRILAYNEYVLGLDPILFLIAFGIFTVYNMFNDPIIGHLCDKSTRLVKRWGKRFPFIMIGAFPFSFMLIFIFTNPMTEVIGKFIWFLSFMFLFDTFFSLMDINRWGLFPKKFITDRDRKRAGFVEAIVDTIGIALGFLIPMLILTPGIGFGKTAIGYSVQAIVVSVVAFILALLMIPGVREPEEVRQRQVNLDQFEYSSLIEDLKRAGKNKNFLGYLMFFVSYSIAMGAVMGVMSIFAAKVLESPGLGELVFFPYLLLVPLTAPFWYRISNKIGIRKVLIIGAILMPLSAIPLLFTPSSTVGMILTLIVASFAGISDGAIESMNAPVFSSIVDKSAVEKKKREEGLFRGIVVFFQRTSYFIWILFYEIITTMAGDPLGLRIYISLFPLAVMGIGVILFIKYYTITQEDLEKTIEKLDELNL